MYNDTAVLIRNLLSKLKTTLELPTKDVVQLNMDRQISIILLDTAISTINESIENKI